jgi:hypothetical protein
MEDRDLHDVEMKDISNVFFDRVYGMSNTRYFRSQEIAHNHCNDLCDLQLLIDDTTPYPNQWQKYI